MKSLFFVFCLLSSRRGRGPRPTASRLLSLVSCLATLLVTAPLLAAVPVKINFTGRMDAVPIDSGVASPASEQVMYMVFRLYAEPGTGLDKDKADALWGRQAPVSLQNGVFDVDLEDGLGSKVTGVRYDTLEEAIDDVLSRGSSVLYIGITPEKDTNAEIFPRMRVTAVTKAVQAKYVRSVPKDFSAADGVFRANGLVVGGAATLADATYGNVDFRTGSANVDFQGGLEVDGTLTAGNVDVSGTLEADDVRSQSYGSSVPVAVTDGGAVQVVRSATLNGDLGAKESDRIIGPTVTVAVVDAPVSNDDTGRVGPASRLVLNDFVNLSGKGFDASIDERVKETDWNILGDWTVLEDKTVNEYQAGSSKIQFTCWDEASSSYVLRTSVLAGRWEAPCDCLAYFQVYLENNSTSSHGACVQFYLVSGVREIASDEPATAVASLHNGKGATLQTVVPLLLRKGQIVRWIGTNDNMNSATGLLEPEDSCVKAIRYRAFSW